MKGSKYKLSAKSKTFLKVFAGILLITISFGVVFGITAKISNVSFVDPYDKTKRLAAADLNGVNNYFNQKSISKWNIDTVDQDGNVIPGSIAAPTSKKADSNSRLVRHQPFFDKEKNGPYVGVKYYDGTEDLNAWANLDPSNDADLQEIEAVMNGRYSTNKFVLDGKDHTSLDHSFNQSLYTGLIRYIHGDMKYEDDKWIRGIFDDDLQPATNADHISIDQNISYVGKPSQDDTTNLQLAYDEAVKGTTNDLPYTLHCVGYTHITPLADYGKNVKTDNAGINYVDYNGKLNDTAIFLYDGSVTNNQSVSSNLFRADQSSFLCALATCTYFLKNIDIFYEDNYPLSIGAFGGINIPTVSIFIGGLQRGLELFNRYILPNLIDKLLANDETAQSDFPSLVKFINERTINATDTSIRDQLIHDLSVQMISLEKTGAYFTGSFVQGDAIQISKELLNRHANAIICVAGPQGVDTAQEINSRASNCIMIGVDSAMEMSDFQRPCTSPIRTQEPEAINEKVSEGIFKFSAIKNIGYFSQKQSELFTQDLNWDIDKKGSTNEPDPQRSICSIGYNTNGNLLNGGCGISEAGWYYLATALQYLYLYDSQNSSTAKSFSDFWSQDIELKNYFLSIHNIDPNDSNLPEGIKVFKNANFRQLVTVPTSDESIGDDKALSLMNYYAMYTEYLGEILDKYGLNFQDDETVEEAGFSSILKWIDDNMYFVN